MEGSGEGNGRWLEGPTGGRLFTDRGLIKQVNLLKIIEASFLAVMEGICTRAKGENYDESCMEG